MTIDDLYRLTPDGYVARCTPLHSEIRRRLRAAGFDMFQPITKTRVGTGETLCFRQEYDAPAALTPDITQSMTPVAVVTPQTRQTQHMTVTRRFVRVVNE